METFERKQSQWNIGSNSDEGRNEDIRGFMEIEKTGRFCMCVSVYVGGLMRKEFQQWEQ